MAQERNLGTARAVDDEDSTKAELQRQMEEARENISQTVNEIKETVTTQYQNVRETVSEALDWREQFRRRPVAFSLGALSAGFIVGYSVAGAMKSEEDTSYGRAFDSSYDDTGVSHDARYQSAGEYLGRPSTRSTSMQAAPLMAGETSRPSYSSGYEASEALQEPDKPGLIERFKGTQAYDRLQDEVGKLGNRFIEQLSTTAQTVVLPALFLKLKDLIGIDLSGSSSQSQGSSTTGNPYTSSTPQPGSIGSRGSTASTPSTGSTTTGANYATSQNQSYGIPSRDRDEYSAGSGTEVNAPEQTGNKVP
jgi:hypothetical protein